MFKGHCFPKAIILQAVYFKLRFSLSYRDIEELLRIRGVVVDHATIQRWVVKFTPLIDMNFRKRKKRAGKRWRLDETYIKVKGKWCDLYRAVDKQGKTTDFLLTHRRNKIAAQLFLIKAIKQNGVPEIINIDKSGANKQGIRTVNKRSSTRIKWRQYKYLNNIVEQDHRFIKWRTKNMLGFKSFESAQITLSGIETVRMIKKDQLINPRIIPFKSFCYLAS
jgi:putative transposase